jgi:hypothetical protein
MDASSCVGRCDGQFHEGDFHGRGIFTSAPAAASSGLHRCPSSGHRGGWTYLGALERDRPTEGELVEADGRRFKVTYAKDCAFIFDNPKPKTKVGVWCCGGGAACGEHACV